MSTELEFILRPSAHYRANKSWRLISVGVNKPACHCQILVYPVFNKPSLLCSLLCLCTVRSCKPVADKRCEYPHVVKYLVIWPAFIDLMTWYNVGQQEVDFNLYGMFGTDAQNIWYQGVERSHIRYYYYYCYCCQWWGSQIFATKICHRGRTFSRLTISLY